MRLRDRLLRDERGATAMEYVFLAAFIAIAILIAVQGLGTAVKNGFSNTSNALTVT
jgi:pilus assembly protein Flp/PilA